MSVLLVCYISSPAHTKRKTFCSHDDDDDHNVYFKIIFLFEFYFFIYLVKSSFILISVFRVPLFWVGAETWGWLWVTQVPLYYMYLIHLIYFIFCLIEGRYCGGGCYLCFILCCAKRKRLNILQYCMCLPKVLLFLFKSFLFMLWFINYCVYYTMHTVTVMFLKA